MPNLLPHFRLLVQRIQPVDAHRSAGGLQERRQHFDGRGLAGPVRTQKSENLTRMNFEGDVIHSLEVTKRLAKILDSNHD